MQLSDIPWRPSTRTLRQFAGFFVLCFGFLAGREVLFQNRPVVGAGLGIAVTIVGALGLFAPGLLRPLFVGWMILVFPLGWVVSRLVLAVVFFGLFTPLALVFRLAGRDALGLRWGSRRATISFWNPRPARSDPRAYFRQF